MFWIFSKNFWVFLARISKTSLLSWKYWELESFFVAQLTISFPMSNSARKYFSFSAKKSSDPRDLLKHSKAFLTIFFLLFCFLHYLWFFFFFFSNSSALCNRDKRFKEKCSYWIISKEKWNKILFPILFLAFSSK